MEKKCFKHNCCHLIKDWLSTKDENIFDAILKELQISFSTMQSFDNLKILELKKKLLKECNIDCYHSTINSFINQKNREKKITENVIKLQQGDKYSNLRNDTFNNLLMLKFELSDEDEYEIYRKASLFNSDTYLAFNKCVETFDIAKSDNFVAYFYLFLKINKINIKDNEDKRILNHQESVNKRTLSNRIIKEYLNLKRKENYRLSLDEFIDQNYSDLSKSKRVETITLYNTFYSGIVSLENNVQYENDEELNFQIADDVLSTEEQAILIEKEQIIVSMLNSLCDKVRKEMKLTFKVMATIDLIKSGINQVKYKDFTEFYLEDYFDFFYEKKTQKDAKIKIDSNSLIKSYLKEKKNVEISSGVIANHKTKYNERKRLFQTQISS